MKIGGLIPWFRKNTEFTFNSELAIRNVSVV